MRKPKSMFMGVTSTETDGMQEVLALNIEQFSIILEAIKAMPAGILCSAFSRGY